MSITAGPGAGKLPPTVQKIHLELAEDIQPQQYGPKQFWRHILPRLKYHNPSIPMSVSRFQDRTQPARLFLHTSASLEPIALELDKGESPETILDQILAQSGRGKFVPVEATPAELKLLEELRVQKEQAERDSEKGRRKRMQVKKQKQMLKMASEGAV
ncbi:hypothetical protein FKW77_001006 [Venturia effusa]|uniref:Ribosomal protein/NADH dehydrogenase domain-containing protein n=1 Tax=Venturia effusa TaxID=50376 RepID=A0A517LD32_9PEZI|nr:hypothetical protein FKW77_001006 [Venturia effusa]